MALHGSLRDMSVADLIQHICLEGKTAGLIIERDGRRASLSFDQGQVVDAELDGQNGEEVVYTILNWDEGSFRLLPSAPAPRRTISRTYTSLLLAGAQRLDEYRNQSLIHAAKESVIMPQKKKSELLSEALTELVANSSDIEGVAIVGTDGLVYSANAPVGKLDETIIGATAAAIFGLSKRSVDQLRRGLYTQSLIQGDKGNIIITHLTPETLFIGLTGVNVNLGMAFAETREAAGKLREIL